MSDESQRPDRAIAAPARLDVLLFLVAVLAGIALYFVLKEIGVAQWIITASVVLVMLCYAAAVTWIPRLGYGSIKPATTLLPRAALHARQHGLRPLRLWFRNRGWIGDAGDRRQTSASRWHRRSRGFPPRAPASDACRSGRGGEHDANGACRSDRAGSGATLDSLSLESAALLDVCDRERLIM